MPRNLRRVLPIAEEERGWLLLVAAMGDSLIHSPCANLRLTEARVEFH